MDRLTVVPDTNIWSYIVEADAVEIIRKAARENNVRIVACPAVVYECLRGSDRQRRRRLAKVLARTCWARPMPEAFLEAEEVRAEVERLRPQWILPNPDLTLWARNKTDWRRAFWTRVRNDPDGMASIISHLGDERLTRARDEAKSARQYAASAGHNTVDLANDRVTYVAKVPGWDGLPVEAWRVDAERHWWSDVVLGRGSTYVDWLGPWLNIEMIRSDRASWVSFWSRDVVPERMPRTWIRWAMAQLQAVRKVTNGTPGDRQIATYLIDFDVFVTSDRGFAHCIDAMRPHSPATLAEVSQSPAGRDAVANLLSVLKRTVDGAPVASAREQHLRSS